MGKGLTSNDRDRIIKILKEIENINYIINIDGIYMGPNTVILGLDLNFKDGLSTEDIEKTIDNIEKRIRNELPFVKKIFVETEEI
ncbi:MAG: cation transporter dimerization domain-containing protein [Thermoplasmata archaeon]